MKQFMNMLRNIKAQIICTLCPLSVGCTSVTTVQAEDRPKQIFFHPFQPGLLFCILVFTLLINCPLGQ